MRDLKLYLYNFIFYSFIFLIPLSMFAFKSNHQNSQFLENAITQSANFYFVCLDLKGKYTYVNTYFSDNFMLSAQKIIGSSFDDHIHTEDIELFQEVFTSAVLHPNKIYALQIQKMNVDGEYSVINWELLGVTNEDEAVIGIQCIGYDATEAYQAKMELGKSRKFDAKLNSIMLHSNDAYVFLDINMQVISFNQKAKEKIRKIYSKELRIDDNFLYFNQEKAGFIEAFGAALRGETRNQEHKVTLVNGEIAWFERRYYPAYDKNHEIIGVVFTSIDITKRKKAEQEIMKQNEQLREIAVLQSQLVRRPIANLLGLLNLIGTKELSSENNELISLLQQSIVDLDGIVHSIVAKANENEVPHSLNHINDKNFVIGRSLQIAS
jgi:PAS domain S-box-containing protein